MPFERTRRPIRQRLAESTFVLFLICCFVFVIVAGSIPYAVTKFEPYIKDYAATASNTLQSFRR